ncbi:ion channel [Natrinema marinum]|uniref:ion channel n=1 Tax=Natrinema marinum TaxID=2961598 RepID=UPI0020C92274|nr:ion channel [Natrinema marinum]
MLETFRPRRTSARVAVVIVTVIAFASIATGIGAILTQPALEAEGVLGDVQSIADFSGTIIGFALLVTAWGLRRGYRLAYVAAVVLVCLSAAHGIVHARVLSVPLVVLSAGGLVVLVATSKRFTRSSHLNATQIGALLSIVGVFCYGTAGAYALQNGFDGVETVVDAVYFTVVTASTVGYGDVHAKTEAARLFAISLVALGPATVAATAGSLFGPAIEAHLTKTGRRATEGRDREPDGAIGGEADDTRVVVLGTGKTIWPVVTALAGRTAVTVVTSENATTFPDGVDVIGGEPTADGALERAALETGDAVLVGAGAGDQHQLVAAVRSRTAARIVAIAGEESVDALERAGADAVVDPDAVLVEATLGALRTGGAASQSSASAASQSG